MQNTEKLKQIVSEKVKELGLRNVKFYYEKIGVDKDGRATGGVFTVCVIRQLNETLARQMADGDILSPVTERDFTYHRGISYCVPKDQFCRAVGRNIALWRAIRALERRQGSEVIPPHVRKITCNLLGVREVYPYPFDFFSQYNVDLSEAEKALWVKKVGCPECGGEGGWKGNEGEGDTMCERCIRYGEGERWLR
jgi:hypothetical protein